MWLHPGIRQIQESDYHWCNEEELIWIVTMMLGSVPASNPDQPTDRDYGDLVDMFKQASEMKHAPFREPRWLTRMPPDLVDEFLEYQMMFSW